MGVRFRWSIMIALCARCEHRVQLLGLLKRLKVQGRDADSIRNRDLDSAASASRLIVVGR